MCGQLHKWQPTYIEQSPYILVPTNFTGSWYHDRGLQVVKEIKSLLVREKTFVGLLIASIVAAITTIATMTTAAVALSQSIQNTHYINTLTQTVSYAFQQQVAIDEKIDICLNSLEAALLPMGDEVRMLNSIKIHYAMQLPPYLCYCSTYNATDFPWKLVKAHVMGAWENNSDSLNLQALRWQILAMQ
jgi:hypothetical protein